MTRSTASADSRATGASVVVMNRSSAATVVPFAKTRSSMTSEPRNEDSSSTRSPSFAPWATTAWSRSRTWATSSGTVNGRGSVSRAAAIPGGPSAGRSGTVRGHLEVVAA